MSKKNPNIIINNTINNVAPESGNESKKNSNGSSLNRIAAIITIIAGLIAIYIFFQDEIQESFESDYNPNVEHTVDG